MKYFLFTLALVSLPVQALTPSVIDGMTAVSTMSKIVVRVTPDPATGQAKFWWVKAKVQYSPNGPVTIFCSKHDLTRSTEIPISNGDLTMAEYVTMQWPTVVMSLEDQAWCLE